MDMQDKQVVKEVHYLVMGKQDFLNMNSIEMLLIELQEN